MRAHTLSRLVLSLVLFAACRNAHGQPDPREGSPADVPSTRSDGTAEESQDDRERPPGDDIGDPQSFPGPDQVQSLLDDQQAKAPSFLEIDWLDGWKTWKSGLSEDTGFNFGGDYNALLFAATDALPGAEDTASGGVLRLYGHWDLIGRETKDTGGLVFKIEHRHRYGEVPPTALGPEVGYLGALQTSFNNDGFRTTNLYWRQSFADQRFVLYAGFLDVTDFVDVYPLASPWTGFNNLTFATGSATIGGLPDGALGAMGAWWLTDSVYAIASIADANARPTDVFEGFDTFFSDFETFKSFELYWVPNREMALFEKINVAVWQIDGASAKDTPSGWGLSGSASATIDDQWLVFVRGGWADGGGSINEGSVSAGFGYQPDPNGSVLGLGLNWGSPNRGTFPGDLDDQFTGELFYRWQLAPNFQLTPSVQLLIDPAANPDDDVIAVFGIRVRFTF